MKLYMGKIDLFLQGKIELDVFRDELESLEDKLLDIEESMQNKDLKLRDLILKTLEVLDNIYITVDESGSMAKVSLRKDLKQLQSFLGDTDILLSGNSGTKNEESTNGKIKENFILSKPGFDLHPGMKSRLPVQQGSNIKELDNFIIDIKKFFQGELKEEIIFDKLDNMEDKLLEMEEFATDNNTKFRDVILKALEILDNIRMILEEPACVEQGKLDDELEKWLNVQNHIKIEYTHHTFTKTVNTGSKKDQSLPKDASGFSPKPSDSNTVDTSSTKESEAQNKHMQQFMLAKPSFEVHPGMKSRLPVQQSTEVDENIKIEVKSSPLYDFLEISKKYLAGDRTLHELKEILENTRYEITNMKHEIENQHFIGDEKDDLLEFAGMLGDNYAQLLEIEKKGEEVEKGRRREFCKILEEVLETFTYMTKTLKEENYIEDLNLLIEDLEDLNNELITLQKHIILPAREVNEEELLIQNITGRISEDDFVTSNYVLVRDTSMKFFKGEINESELKESLQDMRELIKEAKEEYEEAYMSIDGWTLESSIGDKMLREGIKEWREALDCLYEYCINRDEEKINNSIRKIYEANKKLIINQKLEEYINEQVKMRSEYSFGYAPF